MATNLTGGHARCLQALILLAARCLLERMSTGPQPLMSHELLNYAPPPVPERIHNAHIRACSRVYLSFPPFLPSLRSRVRTRTRESRIKVHAQESAYFLAPPFRAALSDRESCEGCELSIDPADGSWTPLVTFRFSLSLFCFYFCRFGTSVLARDLRRGLSDF